MAAPVVARIATAHRAPGHPPIPVAAGVAQTTERMGIGWAGFDRVVRADGAGGRNPTARLQRATGTPVRAIANDGTTEELDADPGDRVRLHRLLADGQWAEDDTGTRGWLPARAPAPPAPAGTTD